MTITFPAPPSTTAPLSQDWGTEYVFEDIEIEEDGIHFGSFWGVADLALNDPAERDFYVRFIVINGMRRERERRGGYDLSIMKRTEAPLHLSRPAKDDQTFKAHLFRKIENALYASEHAAERFAAELED